MLSKTVTLPRGRRAELEAVHSEETDRCARLLEGAAQRNPRDGDILLALAEVLRVTGPTVDVLDREFPASARC